MTKKIVYLPCLLFLLVFIKAYGATCSCASVPLLSSIDATSAEDQQWLVFISLQHQDVSDLYSGSKKVNDETNRKRFSNSIIAQIDYGLSNSWSITSLFSYVQHERNIGISSNSGVSSQGMGDTLIVLKYIPQRFSLFSSLEYSFGLGVKIPTGVNDNTTNGILLAEDMQPGTGAYSWVGLAYVAYALDPAATKRIFLSANYSDNQTNDRHYKLGNEYNITLGWSRYFENKLATTLQLNYRYTNADERGNFEIPNTGGTWLDIIPSIQYVFEKSAIKLSGHIPVYRHLEGALQFTTSYSISLGYSYVF